MRALIARLPAALALALAAGQSDAAVFEVNSNADTGTGSLRAAITALNAHPSATEQHDIVFRLPVGQGGIQLLSALPAIDKPFVRLLGQPVLNPGVRPSLSISSRVPLLRLGSGVQEAEISALDLSQGAPCLDASALSVSADLLLDDLQLRQCGRDVGSGADERGGALRLRGQAVVSNSRFEGSFLGLGSAPGTLLGADIALLQGSLDLVDSRSLGARLVHTDASPSAVCWGGSVYAAVGTSVRVQRSEFEDAIVECGINSAGGALASEGRLELDRVRLRQNIARFGGAVYFAPDTSPTAVLRIQNTLLLDNQAWDYLSPDPDGTGGGLFVRSTLNGPGRVEMRNVSFALNRAGSGIGAHLADSGAHYAHFHSTLFGPSGNSGNGAPGSACGLDSSSLTPATASRSLTTDASCAAFNGIQQVSAGALGLVVVQPPNTSPLDVQLASGSPAIDAGAPGPSSLSDLSACAPLDLDGRTRPLDGNGDGSAICDIGAHERQREELFADGFED